jgi:hypothetical protein
MAMGYTSVGSVTGASGMWCYYCLARPLGVMGPAIVVIGLALTNAFLVFWATCDVRSPDKTKEKENK